MTLREQFEKETGIVSWVTVDGANLFTEDYVEWLEQRQETASAVDTIVGLPVETKETEFAVPKDVAICCDCGTEIYAYVDGWVLEDEENDLWKASSISYDCEDWEACIQLRNRGSYDDAIAMNNRVLKWLNSKYRWSR